MYDFDVAEVPLWVSDFTVSHSKHAGPAYQIHLSREMGVKLKVKTPGVEPRGNSLAS